jgi:hypothetical protein
MIGRNTLSDPTTVTATIRGGTTSIASITTFRYWNYGGYQGRFQSRPGCGYGSRTGISRCLAQHLRTIYVVRSAILISFTYILHNPIIIVTDSGVYPRKVWVGTAFGKRKQKREQKWMRSCLSTKLEQMHRQRSWQKVLTPSP